MSATQTSNKIFVTNYRQKNAEDDPQKTLTEFFSYCGALSSIEVTQDPSKKEYFSAIVTFQDPASSMIALLLNTAVVGHAEERISVVLYEPTPIVHSDLEPAVVESIPIGHSDPELVAVETQKVECEQQTPPPITPTSTIEKLLALGYKLKDGTLDLAKQAEYEFAKIRSTARETANYTIQSTSALLNRVPYAEQIKSVGATVATTGQVALSVTENKLHEISETTVGLFQNTANVISAHTPEQIKVAGNVVISTGQIALDVTGKTLHTATEVTKEALKTVGETVTTTGQVVYDVTGEKLHTVSEVTSGALKVVGETVSTTGQVVYDVTGEKLHSSSETLKTVGTSVVCTSQQKFQQATSATIEGAQIAAATVASLYEANKKPIEEAQATVASIGASLVHGGEVAAAVVSSYFQK